MSDTQVNSRPSLDLDELIPPFVLTAREKRDGLSRRRQAEKEDVHRRRVQLLSILEEVEQLREFSDNSNSSNEHTARYINQLEGDVAKAKRERERMHLDAQQTRLEDVGFLRSVLNAIGQVAALSEVPGYATCLLVDDRIDITMTYARVGFEASSTSPGIVVRNKGENAFTRKMSLDEGGLNTLELLGLAQVLGWSGTLDESTAKLLPSPKAETDPPPVVEAPPVPNPLQALMQSARDAGCVVKISPTR